ncbi:3-oxoadipate enol-lactonase [Geobacillus subterraneus]|uniref:3-oxoadipate enol-lactonase n=2 Tax=Geobacillus TaxID=129337 RepID=A0ABN4NFK7_9BACL|nr:MULTISPECIES: alpha/beta hydrolase [Geobacillus]AMX83411.1 3-oxoadipate enol-lactonase [Geobacillus subterraneus]KZS25217.1 3-oxoadipate enol-lactonase [Geobacillus subterraneus]OXB90434.1 alpha/beta hydrolase [Geobacillus uzenensis]
MKHVELKSVILPNGETIGYREREGGEKPVLLVHGNMVSSMHWDVLFERMDEVYKLYAVDLRGQGISTYNRPIQSLKDFSEDIKQLLDTLGLKKVSLVGWSMGGGVCMQFAADYPDQVEKLVLLASVSTRGYPFYKVDEQGQPILTQRLRTKEEIARDPLRSIPITDAYRKKDKHFLRQLFNVTMYVCHQPSPERYEAYLDEVLKQRNLLDVYYALNYFNISHFDNGLTDGSGEVDRITAPTLVVWGEHDVVVTKNMQDEIVHDFRGRAKFTVLPNAGHSPFTDNPNELLQQLQSFLS